MGKVVGIDLGTTNSVIAVMEGGQPTVISTAEGPRLCHSVVGFSKNGERIVGQLAKRQAVTNPDRTISSIKRKMGSDFKVSIDGKDYTPQEISAMILQKLKADAEAYLGEKVIKAVITVPAYFSDSQRQATKDAGAIAGLEVLRIVNEPTAASLAYGMDKEEVHTVLVWDLGGGTFDVSILELGEGVFEVKSTNGDTMLGGDDWDHAITDWLADEFLKSNGLDLRKDPMALQRLLDAAEKAKIELSNVVSTNINLPFISVTADGPVHLDVALTRAKMEELTAGLLNRMVGPTKQALQDAGMEPEEIDRVLLVGGSTRMPAVQELVTKMFGKEPHRGLNPDEVVAVGAAIQAGVLAGEVKDVVLLDVTPLSLGIETLGGVFTKLIDRNTTIPTSKSREFTTAADGQSEVQIHVLQGEREMACYNKSLGKFSLDGIAPAPRGVPRIEVSFDIDANGIVHVSAKDTATGKAQSVTITGSTGLSKEEIERLVQEAEAHAAEDSRAKELQEARNAADTAIYQAENLLKESKDKLPEELADRLREAVIRAKPAEEADAAAIQAAADELTQVMQEAGASIYAAASQEQAEASEPEPEPAYEGAAADGDVGQDQQDTDAQS